MLYFLLWCFFACGTTRHRLNVEYLRMHVRNTVATKLLYYEYMLLKCTFQKYFLQQVSCCSVHQCFHEMYTIMFNKPLLMIGPSIVPTIPSPFTHKHTTEMSVTLDVLYTMPALTDIIVKVCPGQIIYKYIKSVLFIDLFVYIYF